MSDSEELFEDEKKEDVSEESWNSDDEELEPRFKYSELDGEHANIIKKKEIFTSVDLIDKFIAIGTQSGKIYVLDHAGFANYKHIPIIQAHRCAVSKLKFEETGSYILSCGNDSKLVISTVGVDTNNKFACTINISVMPKSIAIAPDFGQRNSCRLLMGERSLILYEKKLFNFKSTNVYSGAERDGFINCCSWNKNLIAMTNDSGTFVYNRNELTSPLTCIKPSHDIDRVRSSRSPPRHEWLPDMSLIVGWADTITIIKIVETNEGMKGEIHHIWHVSMFISGLSYTVDNSNKMVEIFVAGLQMDNDDMDDGASIISSCTTLTAMENATHPILKTLLLRPLSLKDYELQSEDTIINGNLTKHSLPCNIHMVGIPTLNTYFIITLREIFTALPYSPVDAVQWRLDHRRWDEAYELARNNVDALSTTELEIQTVGRKVIQGFLNSKRPKAAAARLPLICGESKDEWEWVVTVFERARLCTLLSAVLPTSNPQLEAENYECVLQAALFNDARLFKKLIQLWSPDLYHTAYIIKRTQLRIQELTKQDPEKNQETEKILMDALVHLFIYERKYENALKVLVSCKDVQIFNIIDKHQLFDMVKDKISDLMMINSDRALRLLLDNEDSVPAAFVMDKIARQPKLQMAYLTRLLSKNEGSEFADKAVQLYADYDRKKLLPFLRKNEHYHLNRALKICTNKKYVEEMIFLLAKSGNHFDAVNLMVKEYNSIDKVIDYCKEQDDSDLWLYMIQVVSETPVHLSKILVEASLCLNPLIVVQKMPLNTDIPGLKDSLLKVLADFSAHVHLQQNCYDSTLADSKALICSYLNTSSTALYVTSTQKCSMCGLRIVTQNLDVRKATSVRVFGCGHVVHLFCSEEVDRRHHVDDNECVACSEQPTE